MSHQHEWQMVSVGMYTRSSICRTCQERREEHRDGDGGNWYVSGLTASEAQARDAAERHRTEVGWNEPELTEETKMCRGCKHILPLTSFNTSWSNKGGLNSKCRDCIKLEQAHQYEKKKANPLPPRCEALLKLGPNSRGSQCSMSGRHEYNGQHLCGNHLKEAQRADAPPAEEKTCPKCGETKPLSDFWGNRHQADGRCSHCKTCQAALKRGNKPRKVDAIATVVLTKPVVNIDPLPIPIAAPPAAVPDKVPLLAELEEDDLTIEDAGDLVQAALPYFQADAVEAYGKRLAQLTERLQLMQLLAEASEQMSGIGGQLYSLLECEADELRFALIHAGAMLTEMGLLPPQSMIIAPYSDESEEHPYRLYSGGADLVHPALEARREALTRQSTTVNSG